MTVTLEAPPTTRARLPAALCVAVGAAVAVGWVLYRHYAFPHVLERVLSRQVVIDRFWLVNLVQAMLLCLPYALVLLLWGRGLARAAAGATIAVVTGVFAWGWSQVFLTYVWDRNASAGHTSVQVFDWGYLLVIATLVPLAWGVARRRGRTWLPGLLVAPVVATVLRELGLRWTWWESQVSAHWQLQAVVYVAPFVLAALACWALDRPQDGSPEMRSSA
jgi:hypothetical protein